MGAGRVAGVTRARGMVARRTGASGARQIAAAGTLGEAVRALAGTPHRRYLDERAAPAQAQRAVSAALLWRLRVLAGWQPREGAGVIRLLAAGFEIANVEDRLRSMAGADVPRPYRLGALATAWPRLASAGTPSDLRAALAASVWGDPGGDTPAAVATGLRIAVASRVAASVPLAARWAAGRAALLVAREVFLAGRRLLPPSARRAARLLGPQAVGAASFADFRRGLAPEARWAVDGVDAAGDLWRAEARWWTRLEQEGLAMLDGSRYDGTPVVGAVAVLSADAWRVRGALELAARGGRPPEAPDVLV